MSLAVEKSSIPGFLEIKIVGAPGHTALVSLLTKLEAMLATDAFFGLLVDARDAEFPEGRSYSREAWEDTLTILNSIPIAYLKPANFEADREVVIRAVIHEWEADVAFFTEREPAEAWCREQCAARSA